MNAFEGMHLVLATVEESARALSIRQLGAYADSIGVKTTLLFIVKPPGGFIKPREFSPDEIRRVAAFLREEKVTHLGFYVMTGTLLPIRELVAGLRKEGFAGTILAGGIHVMLRPEESLMEEVRFAVRGPGEIPLRRILEGADPAAIPGLVWRDGDGKVRVNEISPDQRIPMDERPFPLWRLGRDKILVKGRLRTLNESLHRAHAGWHGTYYDLLTSVGCVYHCAYCCQTHKGKVLRASVDHAIREIQHARKNLPFLDGVNIQDDSFFSGNSEWSEEFCRRLKAEVGLPFIARMIPKLVTPERLDLMVSGGLVYLTMGLEGSDRLNRNIYHRTETSASFSKAAMTVLERGLILSIDLLIDNPYETEADLREVARTLNALPRPNWWIVALSLTPFPGTPLYERAEREGMLERFPTDAYQAMLVPSRPGAYRTPDFWLKMNTKLLPLIKPELGTSLIEAGPKNAQAAALVDRLTRNFLRLNRITSWLRDRTPTFYFLLYRFLRLFTRKRERPRIMKFT